MTVGSSKGLPLAFAAEEPAFIVIFKVGLDLLTGDAAGAADGFSLWVFIICFEEIQLQLLMC